MVPFFPLFLTHQYKIWLKHFKKFFFSAVPLRKQADPCRQPDIITTANIKNGGQNQSLTTTASPFSWLKPGLNNTQEIRKRKKS